MGSIGDEGIRDDQGRRGSFSLAEVIVCAAARDGGPDREHFEMMNTRLLVLIAISLAVAYVTLAVSLGQI
jgi:hypothetical protein